MMIDFPVDITRQLNAISERGFGTILILDHEEDRAYDKLTKATMGDLDVESRVYKLASRIFSQSPAPQDVAIAGKDTDNPIELVEFLNDLMDINNDWFFMVCTDNSDEAIQALAGFAEVQDKLYATTTNQVIRDELDGSYTSVITSLEYDNTYVAYHEDNEAFLGEGLAVIMSHGIGQKTAKFKNVKGVLESDARASLIEYLHSNGSFTYKRKLGNLETTEGFVTAGEYIDTILGEYWIRFRMEEAAQRVAATNDKIPYSNPGIGLLVGAAEEVLAEAVTRGILLDYEVLYRRREDVPSNDVALRQYDYIDWVAQMAGAIHRGRITGSLTYDQIVREEE